MSTPPPIKEDTALFPKKSRYIKTDKPRPFRCPTCTRGFVRQEHLKRHQIAHTRERPYLCVLCGRCFARRDLVLRHQTKLHPTLNQPNLNNTQIDTSNLENTESVTLNNSSGSNSSSSRASSNNNNNNNTNNTNNNNNIITMFPDSLQEDLNHLNPDLKQDNLEKGILKIVGNTETILPVGLGKEIKKKKLLNRKKTTTSTTTTTKRKQKSSSVLQSLTDSQNDDTNTNSDSKATLRRNNSFSASGSLSYTKAKKDTSDSETSLSSITQPLSIEPTKLFIPRAQSNTINGILNNNTTAVHTNSPVTNINNPVPENIVPSDFIRSSTLPLKELSRINMVNSSMGGPSGVSASPLNLNGQQQCLKVDQYGMLDQDPFSIPALTISRMNSAQPQP